MFRTVVLIVLAFAWFSQAPTLGQDKDKAGRPDKGQSAGKAPSEPKASPAYKKRTDFPSDDEYGKYVQSQLVIGMRVRARQEHGPVKVGTFGTFFGGSPEYVGWASIIWDQDHNSGS